MSQLINFNLTCGQQQLLVPNQLTASMATTCCVQLFDAFLLLSILNEALVPLCLVPMKISVAKAEPRTTQFNTVSGTLY